MWVMLSLFSALFSGTTWVLSKGAKNTDAETAVALRSVVLFGCALLTVVLFGKWNVFIRADIKDALGAVWSGLALTLGWVCYQRAIQGGLGRASAVEKLSVLPIAWAEWRFLGIKLSWISLIGLGMILLGSLRMAEKSTAIDGTKFHKKIGWWIWMLGTVLFTALSAIFSKLSVGELSADVALVIRTGTSVLAILAWMGVRGKLVKIRTVTRVDVWLLLASGVTSALAWIFYFRALQGGNASAVHGLDKLSVIVTTFAGWLLFDEHYSKRALEGMGVLIVGVLVFAFAH